MKSSIVLLILVSILYLTKVCQSDDDEGLAATAPTNAEDTTTAKPTSEAITAEDTTSETTAKPPVTTAEAATEATTLDPTKKLSFKDKYKKFKNKAKIYIHDTTKKLKDILHFDLTKLDIRNLTQFIPFYEEYKNIFNKKYANEQEKEERSSLFKRTIERIRQHNANMKSKYIKGLNELSDMSFAEILKLKLGFKQDGGDVMVKASAPVPSVADLPKEWDWRKYGILTTPRNQDKCGSCWSFAAAAVLESHNMKRQIAEGKFDPMKPLTVSEQNLIDCSADFGTNGCEGGMPQQGFKYVAANQGINSITEYPYTGIKTKCTYNPKKKVDVEVKEGKRLKSGQDNDLVTAIYNYGPVTIALHLTKDMASYKSGIFDDPKCNPKKVNHAVVAVGYTPDYFILRNSWGPKWGDEGYIKVARSKLNNCGISQQCYYPVLTNAVETQHMRDKLQEKP
ncbi:crustapain-like [Oppia nitens]|uniref:crustapain-like n=1 Tax=Oppia nitens TaxID=1686743 RepID=UPI0023DCE1ED|nr:crustapain-like [Oppia nitens]